MREKPVWGCVVLGLIFLGVIGAQYFYEGGLPRFMKGWLVAILEAMIGVPLQLAVYVLLAGLVIGAAFIERICDKNKYNKYKELTATEPRPHEFDRGERSFHGTMMANVAVALFLGGLELAIFLNLWTAFKCFRLSNCESMRRGLYPIHRGILRRYSLLALVAGVLSLTVIITVISLAIHAYGR